MCVSAGFLITSLPSDKCSQVYGIQMDKIPQAAPNFFYKTNTGNMNLCCHLYRLHTQAYDQAVVEKGWNYRLLTKSDGNTSLHVNACKEHNENLLRFSPASFL
jgi:hypothetical protein